MQYELQAAWLMPGIIVLLLVVVGFLLYCCAQVRLEINRLRAKYNALVTDYISFREKVITAITELREIEGLPGGGTWPPPPPDPPISPDP